MASESPAIVVPETLDPIKLLAVLRRARGSFVIVTNEFGVVQGLVTPLDVLEAIAGEFPDADETPEIVADGDGWLVKGTTDCMLCNILWPGHFGQRNEDIATVAGLVIAINGQIPVRVTSWSLRRCISALSKPTTIASTWYVLLKSDRFTTKKSPSMA
jgi:CBS domain containing-hemolysin-like protein